MELFCVKLDIRTLREEDLPGLLASLPEARREKALRCRSGEDRKRSVAAGLLLRRALGEYGLSDALVRYAENGKPYVGGCPEVCLSLSHSGDYAVCALARSPVAIDIQEHDGGRESIVRAGFTPEERSMFEAADGPEARKRVFYGIWCRKECMAKLRSYRHVREIDTFAPAPGFRFYEIPMEECSCVLYTAEPPGTLRTVMYTPENGFMSMEEEPFRLSSPASAAPWQDARRGPR